MVERTGSETETEAGGSVPVAQSFEDFFEIEHDRLLAPSTW
jgi:hypothetical protein